MCRFYIANYIFNSKENVVSDKPENIDISDFESDFNENIEEMAKVLFHCAFTFSRQVRTSQHFLNVLYMITDYVSQLCVRVITTI